MPADAARAVGILGERAAVETRLAEYAVAGLDEVAVLPLAAGDPMGERTLRVPDRIRENAEYIEKNAEARPWLKHAEDADPMVQACYVERDRSAGHDLQRHEGWRGEQGQADRVAYLRDPAHAKDDLAYDRSNDAYGQGRRHSCGPIASQIYDPVAYAVAVTRLHEHPDVRRILAGPYDSERAPGSVRDIPVEEILGPHAHTAVRGFELVGDDHDAEMDNRRAWTKAVRQHIDAGMSPDEAMERVRAAAAAGSGLHEPVITPIPTFAGGTITVRFCDNRDQDGYDINTFFVDPPKEET